MDDAGAEIAINRNRGIFTFVTSIQDEVHRYANAYRKQMMHKKSYAATLTALPGVGEKTSAALLPISRRWQTSAPPPSPTWRRCPASATKRPKPSTTACTGKRPKACRGSCR